MQVEPRTTREPKTPPWGFIGGALLAAAATAIVIAERKRPLRRATQPLVRRTVTNVALGAISIGVVLAIESPITRHLARRAEDRRTGLVQLLPLPPLMRDVLVV